MKNAQIQKDYANFLQQLLYSIEYIDWSNKRVEKTTKLLCNLEKQHASWPEEFAKYQQKVEEAISDFEKGEISECELSERIYKVLNELR